MSTESIARQSHSVAVDDACSSCGAPLAADQRYCLECGERRVAMSSVLLGGPPGRSSAEPPRPPVAPPAVVAPAPAPRSNTPAVIAGVGVLLLAMGVGVLIGRAGGSKASQAPAEVVTVGSTPAAGTTSTPAGEASFTDSWPAGTNGFTVQLKSLPQGTAVSAVEAAKSEAGGKGAKGVGAVKSEDFSSLGGSGYVIYSGVYHKRAEAQKALPGLKKDFPGAHVVAVSNGAAAGAAGGGAAGGAGGSGSTPANPAPPSVVENLNKTKGKSYEEKSKNLPNVLSTG